MNDFKDYQETCKLTANPNSPMWVWALGVAGEAGEVADIVKKVLDHKVTTIKGKDWLDAMKEEMGDVLFYLTALCNYLGLDLGAVARENVEKLAARYPNGFVEGGGIR
jgi:NTP pyrophosphatase (non-canonical NTP hydrolase)